MCHNHSLPPSSCPGPQVVDLVDVSSPLLEVLTALGLPLKFLLLPCPAYFYPYSSYLEYDHSTPVDILLIHISVLKSSSHC